MVKEMAIAPRDTCPTRIAFCVTDLDPGGAERALVQLVTRLDRQRWDPRVYCLTGPGRLVEDLERAGIPTVCFGARRRWQVAVVWKLFRALREFQPTLIQSFLFHANIASRFAGWLAGVPHRISGIRVAERRRKIYLWVDRWTESLIERHVCVSQSVADFSIHPGGLTPGKLMVIPNGVNAEQFSSLAPLELGAWSITTDADVWVTAGRLDTQKGPWVLFEAVRTLSTAYPRLRLLWAGEGPLRQELQTWIDSHQLQHIIQLIGWRDDLPRLLKAAHGFVLTSNWEGMPNVVLEAMAAGLPTVSTRVEGVAEIIENGVTGWLAPVGDSSEFARIWSQVLDNPKQREQVASAGQRHVRETFSWDEMERRYAGLYEQVLNQDAK